MATDWKRIREKWELAESFREQAEDERGESEQLNREFRALYSPHRDGVPHMRVRRRRRGR